MKKRGVRYGMTGTPTAGANSVAGIFERR